MGSAWREQYARYCIRMNEVPGRVSYLARGYCMCVRVCLGVSSAFDHKMYGRDLSIVGGVQSVCKMLYAHVAG